MKNLGIGILVFFVQLLNAQNVYLSRVEKTHDNKDQYFYNIDGEIKNAQYLGEIDVQGFSKDDAAVFSLIYKKAKEIGANSFALKPTENIDGNKKNFDPSHYTLDLYYLPKELRSSEDGNLYLFASSSKDQKISINRKDYILSPRTYLELKLTGGEIYTVSTKKLLGSAIRIQKDAKNSDQYYQISSTKLGAGSQNDGTLHLKSGDIVGLEKSYAEFLKMIYQKMK